MKGLVLYPKVDAGDTTGGNLDERYFRLLARRFRRAHSGATIHLEEFDEDDSSEFLADIDKPQHRNLDMFVYIGHGGRHNLYSAGIGATSDGDVFIEKLRESCNDGGVVLFYACNAGQLNDSLLRTIYLQTIDKRLRLYGHSSAGRAGNNPNKTVFPPSNGAMLIDECLGGLSEAPRFRRAWNATMGNESDDLWATFFTLTNDQLLRRACRSAIRSAAMANRGQMVKLGWQAQRSDIRRLLGVTTMGEDDLAIAIARWQATMFADKTDVDGILGRQSWRLLQQRL